jgi:hypothetical protein
MRIPPTDRSTLAATVLSDCDLVGTTTQPFIDSCWMSSMGNRRGAKRTREGIAEVSAVYGAQRRRR